MNRIGNPQTVDREDELRPYQLFMLLLCVYSLIVLMIETFAQLPAEHVIILDAIDNVVCGIFLLDFLISFGHAPKKLEFLKWSWIDLVSSIPVVDVFRAGRIVRVIRILRVLRGIRLARILARYLQHNRADGTFLAVIFVSILLLLLSSVAILQVEQVEGSNIKTPSDALWWAITTMTTVGYGDKYPVTTVGRIIASMVMITGVGLFGTLSGSVASWILNPAEQRQEVDLDAIQNELAAIRRRLDEFTPETLALDRQRLIDPSNPSPSSAGNQLNVPDLAQLISAWPSLSEETRGEVRRLMGLPGPFEQHRT